MKNILEFLRKPASSVDDLAKKLKAIDNEIPTAKAEVGRLDEERRAGLLSASDAELEKLERRIADARREADRLEAARELVAGRHAEAVAAETRARLDREAEEARSIAEEMIERIQTEYATLASNLASLVEALAEAEAQVIATNERLIAAGRGAEVIQPVENRAIRFAVGVPREHFRLARISLPPAPGFPDGFGDAAYSARLAGVEFSEGAA